MRKWKLPTINGLIFYTSFPLAGIPERIKLTQQPITQGRKARGRTGKGKWKRYLSVVLTVHTQGKVSDPSQSLVRLQTTNSHVSSSSAQSGIYHNVQNFTKKKNLKCYRLSKEAERSVLTHRRLQHTKGVSFSQWPPESVTQVILGIWGCHGAVQDTELRNLSPEKNF